MRHKSETITMKKIFTLSVAASLAAGVFAASATTASAGSRHHHEHECMAQAPIGEFAILGLALGAVTGGVGSAVAYGAAYAVGGAAIGGGAGLLLGVVHEHHHHHC
jgi:K+-transporting ATPase A subunit